VVDQFSIKQKNSDRISSSQIPLDHNQYWILIIYPVVFFFVDQINEYIYTIMLQLNKGISQSIDYNIIIEMIHHHHHHNRHNYTLKSTQSFKQG